jgi:hypothetical protein
MFIKNNILASTIKDRLKSEGIPDPDTLTQKIMGKQWQQAMSKEGAEKSKGRPKKDINIKIVRKQLEAKVPFSVVAASQKVNEGTEKKEERIQSS